MNPIHLTYADTLDASVAVCRHHNYDTTTATPLAGWLWHWRRWLMGEES